MEASWKYNSRLARRSEEIGNLIQRPSRDDYLTED